MEYARTDVVVVGAGPASLTLSELLTRPGKNVTVVERQEDPTSAPQSVTLQPGTVDLLTKT
ncbi:FAD binding domain-containing protein [Actinopolyspora lacussalsi subsp. righensis]|uniref:FAD binding domain-containing protein n=1 Tax=Actinopolyspora righensis TaxID=995060 RepID=A0A1I7AV40_9ACTN|nr:FAD binding domain-containing protein [Actinopolyspora righensis]